MTSNILSSARKHWQRPSYLIGDTRTLLTYWKLDVMVRDRNIWWWSSVLWETAPTLVEDGQSYTVRV